MKIFLVALCLTTSLLTARAEQVATPAEASVKSSFSAAKVRNPFWPIGWKKPDAKNPDGVQPGPALTPGAFSLTSITTGGNEHFAILNGKVMQEGQHFGLQIGPTVYEVTLQAIQDGQVVLSFQGEEIVVPLRRH
jgi:hypothetical protein